MSAAPCGPRPLWHWPPSPRRTAHASPFPCSSGPRPRHPRTTTTSTSTLSCVSCMRPCPSPSPSCPPCTCGRNAGGTGRTPQVGAVVYPGRHGAVFRGRQEQAPEPGRPRRPRAPFLGSPGRAGCSGDRRTEPAPLCSRRQEEEAASRGGRRAPAVAVRPCDPRPAQDAPGGEGAEEEPPAEAADAVRQASAHFHQTGHRVGSRQPRVAHQRGLGAAAGEPDPEGAPPTRASASPSPSSSL